MSGWAAAPNEVLRDPAIPIAAKGLFAVLASHANHKGVCWPSITTLAAETGMHRSTVLRLLNTLRDRGLVTWTVVKTATGRRRDYRVWRPGDAPLSKGG